MGILKCVECKRQVSEAAESCPHCGNPIDDVVLEEMKTLSAKEKREATFFAGCGVIVVLLLVVVCAVRDAPNKPKTAAESRRELLSRHFDPWDGSHTGLTSYIKKHMNDPASYEHVETRYGDRGDHLIIFTKFRGKNMFGGVVVNSCTATVDLNGNVTEASINH